MNLQPSTSVTRYKPVAEVAKTSDEPLTLDKRDTTPELWRVPLHGPVPEIAKTADEHHLVAEVAKTADEPPTLDKRDATRELWRVPLHKLVAKVAKTSDSRCPNDSPGECIVKPDAPI